MRTCPGFFLKSFLESPGNLLEICSVKFVDTLYNISLDSGGSPVTVCDVVCVPGSSVADAERFA